ncbi:MAG: aldo/keto reductase [Spirochaetaceae bacterium]|jgi:predicted aldo/keto reductase-like oxidoreductase|nr:aldo/keto reductase [Spirochaetaceae bacterium]
MVKRHIDSLGVDVSLLGFGCMRLPLIDNDYSKIDYPLAKKMIDRAFEMGVNYFDTAWPYHEKMSEVFVGEALSKYPRDSYFLASKMPTWETFKSPQEDMEKLFSEQLKKCRVDYFDFYLIHSLDAEHLKNCRNYQMYEFLKKKKDEGKIRRLGFSFHDNGELLEEIVNSYAWDFAQIQLNYLDWEVLDAKRLYEYLTEKHIPVVVMEPVRGGALATLSDKAAGLLKKADPQASISSWAIRFAASLPNVMTVLSGMSTLEQVEDNIHTLSDFKPLSEGEYRIINEAVTAYKASGTIPCTGCRYCTDCPQGVAIPRIFSHYNLYQIDKNKGAFTNNYRSLLEQEKAHNCVSCGLCMTHCPQQIKIPDFLKEIAGFAAAG